jgi:hypothetical protein
MINIPITASNKTNSRVPFLPEEAGGGFLFLETERGVTKLLAAGLFMASTLVAVVLLFCCESRSETDGAFFEEARRFYCIERNESVMPSIQNYKSAFLCAFLLLQKKK